MPEDKGNRHTSPEGGHQLTASHRRRAVGSPRPLAPVRDFYGRERELATVATLLLDGTRLITLVGPGGIGKTCLANEAVRKYQKSRRVPVYWVRLARLARNSDVHVVEEEFARAVVDAGCSGRSAWDALVETLSDPAGGRAGQAILVVDNCEHVLAAAGQVINDLLVAVPGLTVLATSREPISWSDERVLEVPPLAQAQALALFRRRAELAGHLIATHEQIQHATSICTRVHNNPLYIRLAAARLHRQPLSMLLGELTGESGDRRLRWSDGPRFGTEERHRRIADVIAWSYNLCTAKERLLFERLAVFAAGNDTQSEDAVGAELESGGAGREAIEAVCADEHADRGPEVLTRAEIGELLERLADQSLVLRHRTRTAVRYSLVESFRVFATERIRERASRSAPDEWARLVARHRRYYRDKIVAAQAEWFGPAEQELLRWAQTARTDLRCAIDESLHTPEAAAEGLQIAIGIVTLRLPMLNGSLGEARTMIERTAAHTRPGSALHIEAKALMAWLSLMCGGYQDAERLLDECVALCLPDPAACADWRACPERDHGLPARVEFVRGAELFLVQHDPRALLVLRRAREKFTAAGDLSGAATSEQAEALAAGMLGTPEQALETANAYLERASRAGARWATSWAQCILALALTKYGDPHEALAMGSKALHGHLAIGDRWGALMGVRIRMSALARLIEDARTGGGSARSRQLTEWATDIARLFGGAAEQHKRIPAMQGNLDPFAASTEAAAAAARTVLGERAFALAAHEGAALRPELDEVTKLAVGDLPLDRSSTRLRTQHHAVAQWHGLTAAEQQVAVLAAAGWTNTAIAARRGSSTKTVDAQMASIFDKLLINSRGHIAELVPVEMRPKVAEESNRRPRRADRARRARYARTAR
ncbi:LuxR C-terminal-related transcriptional regulator [Nocardia sp. NPDC049149]|uniref:helix-turn-helix transcriptional regulator n=1 Tax=Nocardia sp. NPDC049149 TaxID=3364315 RepID=UPI00371AFD0B